jgi:hypothetical protein
MDTLDTKYAEVVQQVKGWPAELRQDLAREILQSLETDAPVSDGEWDEARNARRCELIDKDIQGRISREERRELESLTRQFRAYRQRVAPVPLEGARKLHQQLLEKKQRQEETPAEEA